MSILAALDSPALFAPFFPPRTAATPKDFAGDTWGRWRVFLKAMVAEPLSAPEMDVYRHHTGRQTVPTEPVRKAELIVGRRSGKSRIIATLGTYLATAVDYTEALAPGETPTVLIIAADKKQSRAIFRYVAGLLNSVDALRQMVVSETTDSILLSNGIVIEILAANYRTLRGYTVVACLCDEVAFWRDENSANPAEEVINAVEASLGTLGGMLLLASTPYARRGALFKIFKDNFGREDAEYLVWRGTTSEMNVNFPSRLIARALEEDAARASAEYNVEWRSDIAAFVEREVVEGCVIPGRYELPKMAGCRYIAFTDPAGGSGGDSFTLSIAHPDPKDRTRAILDVAQERKPPFSPEQAVYDFAAVLKSYGLTKITGDAYGGEWPREAFRKNGITYEVSEHFKRDIYQNTLPLLNSSKVELLDIKALVSQLCGLERRTARGGRDSIDHAPGAHDDVANAACGALLRAISNAPRIITQAALDAARDYSYRRAAEQRRQGYW